MSRPASLRLLVLVGSLALFAALMAAGCSQDRPLVTGPDMAPGSGAISTRVIPADAPGMAQAMAAQERATAALLRRTGVIGTGIAGDERGRPVIVIYTDRRGVSGLPGEIEGTPTRVHFTGTVVPFAPPGGGVLQMGTSTGNDLECASGTLGCVVVKGGADYFLSNNHVFARENDGATGERIDAPGRYDGKPKCSQTPQAATLSDFEVIRFESRGNHPQNVIDAAIARPIATRAYTSQMSSGYDPSSTVVAPAVGLAVKKTGRTSGLTHGTIAAINVTITVQYSSGTALFVNQIQTGGNFIRSGDSGSLMVTEVGENPVGLCFAGSPFATFENPIGPVLQRFSATVK